MQRSRLQRSGGGGATRTPRSKAATTTTPKPLTGSKRKSDDCSGQDQEDDGVQSGGGFGGMSVGATARHALAASVSAVTTFFSLSPASFLNLPSSKRQRRMPEGEE